MAVNTAMDATKRRLVYGLNVAVAIVLAVVVVGFAVWAAAAFGGRVDLTRAGLNSVSPRTVQLLRGLEQDITITGLYSTALKEIRPHAEKHKKRVADLLDLYETAARGKVTTHMIDPSKNPTDVTTLLARLIEKPAYKDEAAPHAKALEAFPALQARIVELMQSELDQLEQLRTTDPRTTEIRELATIERFFHKIVQDAQATQTDIKTLEADEIPRYGRAMDVVKDYLAQTRSIMQDVQTWMTGTGVNVPDIAPATKTHFEGAAGRYQEVLAEIEALSNQTQDLKDVKLEEVYDTLKRGETVLVESADEAVVLTQEDVWPWRTDRNAPAPADGDPRDFAGEQAISSAILKMTQKEQTAVVFVRFGGQPLLRGDVSPQNPMQMTDAPYQSLNQLLDRENFITREWDVQTQPEPPIIEDAARVIYVVMPPEVPPQDPRRPSPVPRINAAQKQSIFDAVSESGMAVFLAGWAPPSSPYMPVPEKYEFNDYLKTNWGIEVRDTHVALEFTLSPQRAGLWFPANRMLITSKVFHYTDHPIGKPLRGLPAAFQAVAPLQLLSGEEKPAGVTIEPIAELDDSEDVWAITDLNRINEDLQKNQGTRRYEEDILPPFPLAVAASSEQGQKLVVFASDRFATDAVTNMSQLVMLGGALRLAKLYPGNTDLFINALHWLTGEADRIAVGPQRGDIPRLEKLKDDGTLTFTRVFLVAIWPALALLAGIGVWLLRRR